MQYMQNFSTIVWSQTVTKMTEEESGYANKTKMRKGTNTQSAIWRKNQHNC